MRVDLADADSFLAELPPASVDAIVTSPPYAGLPGRGDVDTLDLVDIVLYHAPRILNDGGELALIVGATEGRPTLPFDVAQRVAGSAYGLRGFYVWDRTDAFHQRRVVDQVQTHDYVIHTTVHGVIAPLWPSSVIRTTMPAFDYGRGKTTPPDLAALLVNATTRQGCLVVDPFAGLAEIGVQAVSSGRRFAGCDIDEHLVDLANARLEAAAR